MINLLIYVVVIVLVTGLAYWLIDVIPIPEPINKMAKIIVIVIAAIALIYALLGLTGNAPRLPS
jgi:hypothetical protein